VALVLVSATVLRGTWNRASSGGPEVSVPVVGTERLSRFLLPIVDLEAITPPPGPRRPGMALDLWLEPDRVHADPDLAVLLFNKAAAVPAGAPPPAGLDPERSYRVPARWIDCRLVGGAPIRMVLPSFRWVFELPPGLRGPARELTMQVGGLGYPYPARSR